MTDFFREVNEDVRRDRAVQILQKYQFWLIGIAVLVIAATAAWRIRDYYRTQAAEGAGARYEAALQMVREGKATEAEAALQAIAGDAPTGYRMLARLRVADGLAATDATAAIKAYDALAADPSYDTSLADVARLRSALLQVDADEPKAFESRFAPLASQSFPYHASIRELLALAAFKRDDFEAAGRWLDQVITDPQAPAGVRRRAEAFLGLVRAGRLPGK